MEATTATTPAAVSPQDQADTLINDTTTDLQTNANANANTGVPSGAINGQTQAGLDQGNQMQDELDNLYLGMQELQFRSEVSELNHKTAITILAKISDAAIR
jgi:hypothetical protein